MAIQPTQPQSIGGVLDSVFQLYKASVGKVLAISLIMAVASMIPSIYIWFTTMSGAQPDINAMAGLLFSPGYWLVILLSMLVSTWGMAAMYAKIHAIAVDEALSIGGAFGVATGRLLPAFFSLLLYIIAVMIGMLLLLVPGLILMVSLILAVALVVIEAKGPIEALTGSHRLVWGNWWRTLVVLTIAFFIILVLYFAAVFAIGLLMPSPETADLTDIMVYTQITSVIIGALMNIVLAPFTCALLLGIYYDLKLRKEGGDLSARVGALNPA